MVHSSCLTFIKFNHHRLRLLCTDVSSSLFTPFFQGDTLTTLYGPITHASAYTEGDMGGSEHRNNAKKQKKRTPHHRKKSQRNTVTATRIFSAMIRSSTLKIMLLHLNSFPQNKHITTLFIAHMSILLIPVNQFSCSCEETLREAWKLTKKKERSLERWPLPQIPLFFYFSHLPTDRSPILTESIAFRSQLSLRSISIIV